MMTEIFDNIRAIYHFAIPCPELSDHIEFFSETSPEASSIHTGGENFTVKMFPSYTPTIWFNLGSPYHLKMGSRTQLIPPGTDILITRNIIVERCNLPTDHIFSIKFFPGGLEAILGIDQSKMKNQIVELSEIIPLSFINRIREQRSFEERMKLLQQFFINQFEKRKKCDHYIQFVKDTIAFYERGKMQYNVTELSARSFIHSKTINRYFNRVVGVSPKTYFSILRARTALTAFVENKQAFDPRDFGYYDGSHFYKEMHHFTECSLAVHKK
jgi:AraC-like DNA-binding protein